MEDLSLFIKAKKIPIDVVDLLPVMDTMLIELLQSLNAEEWQKQTVSKLGTVKDVAAHLLDGNIRALSMLRDKYVGETPAISPDEDLIAYLNGLNTSWVKAMKRVSPKMLIMLHRITGKPFCEYYNAMNPFGKSGFPVDWAGEQESENWMHIACTYTQKWLHQQQIRDAIDKPGLMSYEFFNPFIDIFMLALPYTYRNVEVKPDTTIKITITSDIGGSWYLTKTTDNWQLAREEFLYDVDDVYPVTVITIDPDTAWRLFSRSVTSEEVKNKITIAGNQQLGQAALSMVAVMS
ncbi:MAG TPA: hypothetical protein VN721_08260 [Flavipsychrobacter sp.]|nr:hypothetical protein [Flavipsychrobacter sp.]